MINLYISVISLVFVLNLLGFFLGYLLKTDRFTDITYSLSFVCAVFAGFAFLEDYSLYVLVLGIMILLWAFRLGWFLFRRILKMGKDRRFDEMRTSFISFGAFWLLQSLSIIILLLPVLAVFSDPAKEIGLFSLLGLGFWIAGWIIEWVADEQKFRLKERNPEIWMKTGLYGWVRYPNYLGEIMIWIGIWIYGLGAYAGWQWIGILSPLWIIILLRYISGIPLIEKYRTTKYGHDPEYQQYVKNTPMLLPFLRKK